ncbi:MAG: helix-turn-helix transcriptional regulator [Lachnospiraceae bacterium]|nr:helix-turn-helix transcriptional regulator [Lachnospiraceae bacterium]
MKYQNEWLLLEADDMADEMEHRQPTEEFLFYEAVVSGDVETVRKNCEQKRFLDKEGVGVLSKDPVTNLKYHFVITTAMITRLCRQRGMELEQAFRMSDFYIQSLDDMQTLQEIGRLHDEMVLDYTEKMRRISRRDTGSRHISACKEYIYTHIKERMTIEEIAEQIGVSPGYLSRLFKKETGASVSAYIRAQKIEMAKNMLRYSDCAMVDIANRLSFASQSHFIQQFREQTGMTPKKYRDLNYMVHWDIDEGSNGDGTHNR